MTCRIAEGLLSEYIDDALSARDTLAVEKHLAECHGCTRLLNETRRTVGLLAGAQRFDLSSEFAEKLQERLAGVEQHPARMAWVESLHALFRPRVLPIWGAAAGACALIVLVVATGSLRVHPRATGLPASTGARIVQTARVQSIALAASDPFGDTAAASVAANAANSAAPQNSADTAAEEPVN